MVDPVTPDMSRWCHPSGGELWTLDPLFREPLDLDDLSWRLAVQMGRDPVGIRSVLVDIERGTGKSFANRDDHPFLYAVVSEFRRSPDRGPRDELLEGMARRLGLSTDAAREWVEDIERLTGRSFDRPVHRAIITVAISITAGTVGGHFLS